MLYTRVMVTKKSDKTRTPRKDRPFYQRIIIDIAGFGLMIISPLLGWLPGPGGIPLFLAGLGLVALNHEWAENLLLDFEKKREQFTSKFLMASPRVSRTIDVVGLVVICAGVYSAATQTHILLRGLSLAITSITLIVLLSNQKRFERLIKLIRRK